MLQENLEQWWEELRKEEQMAEKFGERVERRERKFWEQAARDQLEIFVPLAMVWAVVVVFMAIMYMVVLCVNARAADPEPYVMVGVGAWKGLQTSNSDPVEVGTDTMWQGDVAVGARQAIGEGPFAVRGEVEGIYRPTPLHGQNDQNKSHGDAAARHRTADGQTLQSGALMVNVAPEVEVLEGVKPYVLVGGGLGLRDDEGATYAWQGGAGVVVDVTDQIGVDGSFRYTNIGGIEGVGPHLAMTYRW